MHDSRFFVVLLLTFTVALPYTAFSQRNVRLKQADEARGGRMPDGERYQRVIGNVIFTQRETTIYCDSAHFFRQRDRIEAYGRVRIHDGDSIRITGSYLEYQGESRTAKLRRNVVFRKLGQTTLYTDNLDFHRESNIASYFNGGRLVDSTNTLTSQRGTFNMTSNIATFRNNVKVTNPDYTMTADSLRYDSKNKIIHFITKTNVVQKDGTTLTYETGTYDTRTRAADIARGRAESEDYTMDYLNFEYDGIQQIGRARGNVVLTHKHDNLLIYGQATDHYEKTGITKIYDDAYVAKVSSDLDTLFITADTLVSIESDDASKKRLLAYGTVKIFKRDIQGIADSVEYRFSDSTLYFYQDPVLWSEANQMTADSIWMQIENNTVNRVYLVDNAFVISQDTLKNFNQIKGRTMRADFADNQLHRVYVNGNGETIYFSLEEDNRSVMGMNKLICSRFTIRFFDGKVNNISFYVQPEGEFIPPHEIKDDNRRLKNFNWQADKKPTRDQVVKAQRPVPPATTPKGTK